MTNKTSLRIEQSDLLYSARLREPSLRLFLNATEVADWLLVGFAKFGAQVENLAALVAGQDLSQSRISMSFLGGYGTVQLSPLGGEMLLRGPGDAYRNVPLILPLPELSEMLRAVTDTVERATGQTGFAHHSFVLNLHASLRDQDPGTLLRRFVEAPPAALGEVQEVGVKYVLKPTGNRLSAGLVAEPSAVVNPGLFMSCSVTFDGSLVGASSSANEARQYLHSILNSPECPVEISDE